MFTGLVESIGVIHALEKIGGDVRIRVQASVASETSPGKVEDAANQLGASIAVNGVCLTVVDVQVGETAHGSATQQWVFDVSTETLQRSSLGGLVVGSHVNLEWSLTLNKPMGGHWVTGHVDAVGEVVAKAPSARATLWTIRYPKTVAPFIAEKGSICLDGISLTVNAVTDDTCEVAIIPHTQANTTIQFWQLGSRINIEVDIVARYLMRMVQVGEFKQLGKFKGVEKSVLSTDQLAVWGYDQ